jgi:Holliday junction resolvase RusA-like endonuclease
MEYIKIHTKAKPKPRGQLNKSGRMTHSLNGYREWQNEICLILSDAKFIIPENFYGIIFVFNIKPSKGRPPDLSNLQGAIEDVLVKYKYIVDDNWKILKRYYTLGIPSTEDSIEIFAVVDKTEFLKIVDMYS